MTATQYYSNNSLTAEFKWASFEKRNNLDELIPIKAEERFVIQISFRRHNPESASKITADPRPAVFSKSANPLDFPHKSTIRPCAFQGQICWSENLFTPLVLVWTEKSLKTKFSKTNHVISLIKFFSTTDPKYKVCCVLQFLRCRGMGP